LIAELDEKDHELQDVAARVDEEWREEVEGARQAEKEAKEVICSPLDSLSEQY